MRPELTSGLSMKHESPNTIGIDRRDVRSSTSLTDVPCAKCGTNGRQWPVLRTMQDGWGHRIDCFLVGAVVGMVSASNVIVSESVDSRLYVALLATLTLSPVGLPLPGHGSLPRLALSVARRCLLGVVAVIAGIIVGVDLLSNFAP